MEPSVLCNIERASELAKKYLHAPGVFEGIQERILQETRQTSEFTSIDARRISSRPMKKVAGNFIHIASLSCGDVGDHYAAFIRDGDETILYDPIRQHGEEYDEDMANGFIGYIEPNVTGSFVVPAVTRVQRTGGFITDDMSKKQQWDVDSQDHFCYMWCLLFLHVYLYFRGKKDAWEHIYSFYQSMKTPRLRFIKQYIYAWLCHLEEFVPDPFFDKYFLSYYEGKRKGFSVAVPDSVTTLIAGPKKRKT